ncbi:MAG: metal ABC transporter permease [Candidatus Hydrogenedens sp.]|nr:metal ABC transporter permease [Candidatus Hydrogenedens sp.]
MLDALSAEFMQRALLAGLLVSLAASYFSPFVVQRRMAFLGSGLAHAAFGGVALGVFLGWAPLYTALPFTVAAALAIVAVRHHSALDIDTAIGILFALAMALGMIFLYLTPFYTRDAFTYLFGSLLALGPSDIWLAAGVCALTAALVPWWSAWAFASFDRELAVADRIPANRHDYLLAAALAALIVASIKVVGIILVSAFLVLPGAAARPLAKRFRTFTLLSLAIGTSTTIGGLLLSAPLNLPSGPVIILCQCGVFAAALLAARWQD